MNALEALRKLFPDATPETIGLFGLLLSLTFLEDNPATEGARWQHLEQLMASIAALSKTLNAEQKAQLADIVTCFFILGDSLLRPHIRGKVKRVRPLDARNLSKTATAERAKEIARELWSADTAKEIRIGDMAEKVYRKLAAEGFAEWLPDTVERLREWIKPAAPDYARKGGRRRKTT